MISRAPQSPCVSAPPRTVDIEVTRHDLPVANLPHALEGATIVQLSDLHRGNGDADPRILEAVRITNSLAPDYVCITGDFIDSRTSDILPVVRIVAGLRATRGIFATIGNHDHRGDIVLLSSALDAAGITVLNNTALELAPGLWIAGIDDLDEGDPDIADTLSSVPAAAPCILMTHRPN